MERSTLYFLFSFRHSNEDVISGVVMALKIMSSSDQVQSIKRYSPGSFSVLISTIFSVNVAFSFLQLIQNAINSFCPKYIFQLSIKFSIESQAYLYFIKVESLAKELAAREISVSTMGLTT